MRSLSPEEAELWARVAATIRPLSHRQAVTQTSDTPKKINLSLVERRSTAVHPSSLQPRPLAVSERTLDGGWDRKLGSGSIEPDRVLDLHGMNLDAAWHAIDRTLDQAIARGDRIILLITGHHRQSDAPVQRGRIRAAVHDWLAASRHAQDIAAVRPAHRRHGGGGSLYLVLRRRRSPR